MGWTRWLISIAALVSCAAPAWADECVDPFKRAALSPGKKFAIQFTPKKRDCSEEYACGDDPRTTGELEGDPKAPTLTLFELHPRGKKKQIWSKLLLDGYEPMGMVVSDDGNFVVLSDDWCGSGLGDDVVVLIGPGGDKLQQWSLSQLLPDTYNEAFLQSSPNIRWRGEIRYDPAARGFNFQVAVAIGQQYPTEYLDFLLDPEKRTFTPRDPAKWEKAFAYGEAIVRNRCDTYKWRMARAAVPLSAPTGTDRVTWFDYSRELEERIVLPKLESYRWTQRLFLSLPNDPAYAKDLKEFRRVLTFIGATRISGDFYLVSPDLQNAHAILKAFLAEEKDRDLSNDRFIVAGDGTAASAIAATISSYGGQQVKIIGPSESVPPARDRKDYDWKSKQACAAISEGGKQPGH